MIHQITNAFYQWANWHDEEVFALLLVLQTITITLLLFTWTWIFSLRERLSWLEQDFDDCNDYNEYTADDEREYIDNQYEEQR